jgi:acetylglutamate kinase
MSQPTERTASPTTIVLKVGGNQVDDVSFLDALASTVATMAERVVIVHGGGKEVAALQERLGLTPKYVEGLRVTDDESLTVVEMVLSGLVNKRLVSRLVAAGVEAIGLSGVDLALVRVEKMDHPAGDLGWVGEVVEVRGERLVQLLDGGIIPVISPISLGRDGHTYNVNADHVATAVARAIEAAALLFVTDVPGVLVEGQVVQQLTADRAATLIANGTIAGGMVPKVRSALAAVAAGVPEARIVDLEGVRLGGGTRVVLGSRNSWEFD